jgi:hypothetical protein
MNPALQAIDGAQDKFIGWDGKVDMAALLDAEARSPAPAASGSEEIATLSATAQKTFIGKDGKVDMVALLNAEAGLPAPASSDSEEIATLSATAQKTFIGENGKVDMVALLNAEDSCQEFHINTSQIISLNKPPTEE